MKGYRMHERKGNTGGVKTHGGLKASPKVAKMHGAYKGSKGTKYTGAMKK